MCENKLIGTCSDLCEKRKHKHPITRICSPQKSQNYDVEVKTLLQYVTGWNKDWLSPTDESNYIVQDLIM